MRKIIIDPGHGDAGCDWGAVAKDGTRESDIVLNLAKKLESMLTQKGYNVILTRKSRINNLPITSNKLGDLPARTGIANKEKADLFISLHCNSNTNTSANGTEIYYCSGSKDGKNLAAKILNELLYLQKIKLKKSNNPNFWDFINRGKKEATFYVLSETNMPAVLVETLFLSNKDDLTNLKSEEFLTTYATAITNGINMYFK